MASITHWQALVARIAIREAATECIIRERAEYASVRNFRSDASIPDMLAYPRVVRSMRERRTRQC